MIGNTLIQIAAYGGGGYLLLNLYALLISDKLLFVPQKPGYTRLPDEIKIRSGHGAMINAVFLENEQAKHTLLFSHGNAEDLSGVVPFMRRFHDLGYSVMMYDYRGYGTSEGRPSTNRVKQDVSAVYRWLVEAKQIDPKTIISHGRSLGGGVAVWLAATHEVGGVIVENTFASAFRVKTRWPLLPWDKFNSVRSIRRVHCPVLVIHGRLDSVIPFWHGEKLFATAPGSRQHLWIEDGTHTNYVYAAGDKYTDAIVRFISGLPG